MTENEKDMEKYKHAGKIAAEVMEHGLSLIEEEKSLLETVNAIESTIVKMGAKPAFPANISINERAAHYTANVDDATVFEKGDVVKLDIGVHVDGYIGDIARTKIIGESSGAKQKLVEASKKALENAIGAIKPGKNTGEIGGIIEETIKSYGFNPIVNLTGHMLKRYELHGGIVIPNIKTPHGYEFKEGDVFAIEPFATTGSGKVIDESIALIFRYEKDARVRLDDARKILNYAKENCNKLPFAERWIAHLVPRFKLGTAIRQLVELGALHPYKILKEKENGIVSQAEDSIVVTKDECEVLTRK